MYVPQPIETVILRDSDADTALALAHFVKEMGGIIDFLKHDEEYDTWRMLARMHRGMWHVPKDLLAEASQTTLF